MADTTAGHHEGPSAAEPHAPKGHARLNPLPDTSDKVNEDAVQRFNTTQSAERTNARSAGLLIAGLAIVLTLWIWNPISWWNSRNPSPAPPQATGANQPPVLPQEAGPCPPGEIRLTVGAPCSPKGSVAATQPATPAARPTVTTASAAPAVSPVRYITYTCSRKEATADLQLLREGFEVHFVIARPCTYAFKVLRGEVRVIYTDGTHKDFGLTTCPNGAASDADCAASWKKTPRTMISLSASSAIDLTLDPK